MARIDRAPAAGRAARSAAGRVTTADRKPVQTPAWLAICRRGPSRRRPKAGARPLDICGDPCPSV